MTAPSTAPDLGAVGTREGSIRLVVGEPVRTQQHAARSIRMFVDPDLRPGETAASTTARSTGAGSSSTFSAPPIKHSGCRGLKHREQAYLPKYPSKDPHYRILAHQRSRFTHYYFYIRDEALGPMVLLVGSFFPFQTAYYLNGHSFIEQELKRAGIGFRKRDNAFLAVAQATVDRKPRSLRQ